MAQRVLALTIDGRMTYCTCTEDQRGKGRCNHVTHQNDGESTDEFIERVSVENGYRVTPETDYKTIKVSPYRMTDEEKKDLMKIDGRKQLEDENCEGGYIELSTPLWNDVDKTAFCKEHGFNRSTLNDVLSGKKSLVVEADESCGLKEGMIIDTEKFEKDPKYAMSSAGLETGVEAMNKIAAEKGFEATTDVYVVPYYMRMDPPDGSGKHPLNTLYNFMIYNRKDPNKQQAAYDSLLNNSKAAKPLTQRGGWAIPSLVDDLKGKSGIMRGYMTGRDVSFSARAVLGVDASMEYDQLKIPCSAACDIYRPAITDSLRQRGMSEPEIHDFFEQYRGDQRTIKPEARKQLDEVVQGLGVRVIANRQPSLHQASLLSFRPRISEDATIKANPLNFGGYNADLDGDTMTVFAINDVNISEKSKVFGSESKIATHLPRAQQEQIIKPTKDAMWGLLNILGKRSN